MKKKLVMSLILSLAFGSFAVFADTPPEIYQSLTDKSTKQIKEMRQEGKTLWEAAKEEGVLEEFKDRMYEDAKERLDKGVKEGKLTQEEADEKLSDFEEKLEEGKLPIRRGCKKGLTEEDKENMLQKAEDKIKKAVEEGRLTQDEADDKLAKLEEKMKNGNYCGRYGFRKEMTDEEKASIIEKAKEKFEKAVEEGVMTQEEVSDKLEVLKVKKIKNL